MVPTQFNPEVVLIIEEIAGRKIILWNGKPVKMPILVHAWFVMGNGIKEHEVVTIVWVGIMAIDVNVALGIPVTVIPPLNVEFAGFFWFRNAEVLCYGKSNQPWKRHRKEEQDAKYQANME